MCLLIISVIYFDLLEASQICDVIRQITVEIIKYACNHYVRHCMDFGVHGSAA